MKRIAIIVLAINCCIAALAQEKKIISDCTILFSVTGSKPGEKAIGSKTIYVKGKQLRVDFVTQNFSQTTFFNSADSNAAVLKTIGDSKFITKYTAEEWEKANSVFEDISVTTRDSVKNILGYNCKKATIALKDGNTYTVYYVPGLMPSVMEAPFQSQNIPGLVLEYEAITKNNGRILYSAQKIDFRPVASRQFDIQENGYRILHN